VNAKWLKKFLLKQKSRCIISILQTKPINIILHPSIVWTKTHFFTWICAFFHPNWQFHLHFIIHPIEKRCNGRKKRKKSYVLSTKSGDLFWRGAIWPHDVQKGWSPIQPIPNFFNFIVSLTVIFIVLHCIDVI